MTKEGCKRSNIPVNVGVQRVSIPLFVERFGCDRILCKYEQGDIDLDEVERKICSKACSKFKEK